LAVEFEALGGNNMKKYVFSVLIEKDEDGVFMASVPELKGCRTQGNSVAEVLCHIKEAISLCLEAHEKDGIDVFNRNFILTQPVEMVVA
jgi:predicted RNase H-like HicB family nuclease